MLLSPRLLLRQEGEREREEESERSVGRTYSGDNVKILIPDNKIFLQLFCTYSRTHAPSTVNIFSCVFIIDKIHISVAFTSRMLLT